MSRLVVSAAALAAVLVMPARAGTVDLASIPMADGGTSLSFSWDGIGITATAYSAEYDAVAGTASVHGPFSTAEVPVTSASFDYFVFGRVTSASTGLPVTGLGLLSDEAQGQSDSDRGSGVIQPGFDNSSLGSLPSLQFAVFAFDTPVSVSGVTVDDTSNHGRALWAAGGLSAPDFSQGLESALSMFSVVNSPDTAGDGLLAHALAFDNIRYLLVGTPPRTGVGDLGPLTEAGNTQFYIQELEITPVPLPGSLSMLLGGLIALAGLTRHVRTVSPRL